VAVTACFLGAASDVLSIVSTATGSAVGAALAVIVVIAASAVGGAASTTATATDDDNNINNVEGKGEGRARRRVAALWTSAGNGGTVSGITAGIAADVADVIETEATTGWRRHFHGWSEFT
jgi:uncharacterized membrane protein